MLGAAGGGGGPGGGGGGGAVVGGPLSAAGLGANGATGSKPVRSVGQCSNIMESEDVHVQVNCVDGPRTLTFKSATKCACYHCKKD